MKREAERGGKKEVEVDQQKLSTEKEERKEVGGIF
jgi:hypothetical protein